MRGLARLLILLALVLGLAIPAMSLDVLVNQVGFEPESPKVFRAQRATDYAGDGTFSVKRVSDNAVVFSGALTRKGGLWNKYYWAGDFSSLETAGDYYVSATVDAESGNSYNFTIGSGVLLDKTGKLVYQYYTAQRCGAAVSLQYINRSGSLVTWSHNLCHTDDGYYYPSGPYCDTAGGWHDSGEYQKYGQFFGGNPVFDLLCLYDSNRSFFDAIDANSNGIADILDEALWQARWLAKMVQVNGHVMKQISMRRDGASWVRPEYDTDRIIGTSDDRWVEIGDEATPQETVVCASLIRMHRVLASKGLPTENFASKALSIWNHRVALAISEGGHNNLGAGGHHVFAGLDLYAVFGQQDCWDRSIQRIDEMTNSVLGNPAVYDDNAEAPGYELGALVWFVRDYPSHPEAVSARSAIQALMSHNIDLADNPIGLIRRNEGGSLIYFPANPSLGINRLYGLVAWAAIKAYRLIGDASYLRFALDQYNWILGANYNKVCMMEAAGDYHLNKYHTRYDTFVTNGIEPGVVPNGYIRSDVGLPWIDFGTGSVSAQTNEGWLPNNAAYAMALSAMHNFDATPPGLVMSFTSVPGDQQVSLSWTNPSDSDFAGTIIRYSTTGFPTSPTDGSLLIDKPNTPGSNDSHVHSSLENGMLYYYSAFARDIYGNYSAAANVSARPAGPICVEEPFDYPGGLLHGNDGWVGPSCTTTSISGQTLQICGGAGACYVIKTTYCDGEIGIWMKMMGTGGSYTFWGVRFDDPSGVNLARWYGTGATLRGRWGDSGSVTPVANFTGGWDELYVRIDFTANTSTFVFNGTTLGTLSHTGAGEAVGRVSIERIDNISAAGNCVYLDDLLIAQADTSAPVPVVSGPSAPLTRTGPVSYTVNFSEPVFGFNASSDIQVNATGSAAAGLVNVTGSGSGPYTVTLSNITGGGTLCITVKSSAAADVCGNGNTASAASATFKVLASDGSIADARALPNGSSVELAGKVLYVNQGGFAYIEEPSRTCGVRIQGLGLPAAGNYVLLTGTMQTRVGPERYILVDQIVSSGAGTVGALAMNNRDVLRPPAAGLRAAIWGRVKPGSITTTWFLLTDGSNEGTKVQCVGAPGVTNNEFVIVRGAVGVNSQSVIYRE